jgi:hypothetical protein
METDGDVAFGTKADFTAICHSIEGVAGFGGWP